MFATIFIYYFLVVKSIQSVKSATQRIVRGNTGNPLVLNLQSPAVDCVFSKLM